MLQVCGRFKILSVLFFILKYVPVPLIHVWVAVLPVDWVTRNKEKIKTFTYSNLYQRGKGFSSDPQKRYKMHVNKFFMRLLGFL